MQSPPIALVATAVQVGGERVVVQAGQPLPLPPPSAAAPESTPEPTPAPKPRKP